jgi:hypothetical protein
LEAVCNVTFTIPETWAPLAGDRNVIGVAEGGVGVDAPFGVAVTLGVVERLFTTTEIAAEPTGS